MDNKITAFWAPEETPDSNIRFYKVSQENVAFRTPFK